MSKHAYRGTGRIARLLAAFLAIVLTSLVTSFLSSSPSTAAPNRLLVSDTGAAGTWSDNLTSPLFDELGPFVPLDNESDSFWVKNNSNQPARATFAVLSTRPDGEPKNDFEDRLEFTYDVGETNGEPTEVIRYQNRCKAYVTGATIPPGESMPVNVGLTFADADGLTAQDQQARVSFVVTLSQVTQKGMIDICGVQAEAEPFTVCKSPNAAVVTLVGRTPCPQVKGAEAFADTRGAAVGSGPNALGDTGAPRSITTVLPLALGLLLAGGLLLAARRRPESD